MKDVATPGQALLDSIKHAVPLEERPSFDGFVSRNLAALVARLDKWILEDSEELSRRAVPDAVLFGATRWEQEELLLPILGNY